MKNELFAEIEPYDTGTLPVSDLHTLFYEQVGNPEGRPALFLHGGPGVGILPGYRRFFDPGFYRVVLPDQRGAGRSTPHAELEENTTEHLVEDLEKLRLHLGLDPWVVMGGSWGSTLALCYAIAYPESVRGIIIRGIFLARPLEIEWLFKEGGAGEIYPDRWEPFLSTIPEDERDDLVGAYHRRMNDEDESVRLAAARAWVTWEGSIMNLLPDPEALAEISRDGSALSIGRIECQYTLNGFHMPSANHILDNADRIREVPCRIVQGRYDIICPTRSAWDLHRALPRSELRIVPDGAHSPLDPGMVHELIQASEDFKVLY
jgi:proline iminopeptidase